MTTEPNDEAGDVVIPGHHPPISKTVTATFRGTSYQLERRSYTTEQLFEVFPVPDGHKLDLVGDDGKFQELKPGESIRVYEGMEFTSHPPRGQAS